MKLIEMKSNNIVSNFAVRHYPDIYARCFGDCYFCITVGKYLIYSTLVGNMQMFKM